jgi:hypothetical protein
MHHLAKYIVFFGILLIVIGIVLYFIGNKLNWLGKLPGDIRIEKENFRLYVPVTTMIVVSVVLTLIVKLFRCFIK